MYYRQPRYFGDFHCIGNACPDNCCYGWNILWKEEEVDKLKTAENCSPELAGIIEKAFVPNKFTEGTYLIAFNEKGKCPLLTDDGLCRIQKELGVEYMSGTCMDYPRLYFSSESAIYQYCCSSCREIMRRLLNDEKSMDLVNVPIKKKQTLKIKVDSAKELADHPELKYRSELFEFFYEIIADKKHDVETNIILGALAAQSLTKLVESGEIDTIPETLKTLKAQMHNGAQLKKIENIKPNYQLKFGFVGKMLNKIDGWTTTNLLNDKSGTPNIIYYDTANERLNESFKDRPFYLRNIALNLLMELAVPFNFKDKTIFENYSLFATVFACIKLNMIALALNGDGKIDFLTHGVKFLYDGKDKFVGMTSIICRYLCQSPDNQKAMLKMLEENKFTSPAYLALLVK